jgi:uncharacterized membrane protein YccC
MSAVPVAARPWRFAGFPLSAWAFALRNWIAMMLALYVAFWLQLESASSAATCVGILALQTRGQAMQKAVYRMAGTVVGVVVSFVIAGLFNETREIFFVACAAWLGLCAVSASLFDGNRAYGAILSGYTVGIVAIAQTDAPQQVFSAGVNRGAAIAVGIAAIAVVNDFFAAPDTFPTVLAKLKAARMKVRAFAVEAVRQGGARPSATAALLREITALHPDITALASESVSGRARGAAARAAAIAMVREVSAARVVSAALADMGPEGDGPRERLLAALAGRDQEAMLRRAQDVLDQPGVPDARLIGASAWLVLFEQDRTAAAALADLESDRRPAGSARLQLYRSRRIAIRNGIRSFLAVCLSIAFLALSGWPSTTIALVQISALVGLSATNPNPRGFAVGAMIAMPLVVVVAGVTEFLVLDGADQFPLLMLAMVPPVLAASLMLASGNPTLYGIGFLLLVFVPVVLSPSNPQDYNPQSFLYAGILNVTSVVGLFVLLAVLLPTSDGQRRTWMLASAARDLRVAIEGSRHFDPPAAGFRDADRVGQFSTLAIDDPEGDIRHLLRSSDLAAAARRIRTETAAAGLDQTLRDPALAALAGLDPAGLKTAGRAILARTHACSDADKPIVRHIAAQLIYAAVLMERSPVVMADLRKALAS